MQLFEGTWRENYQFYERVFDTELKHSIKRTITTPHEWYEEKSSGLYTYVLDENIHLDKMQGNPKNGYGKYGFLDPMYRNIRDNYWNQDKYNLDPRVWYLDIETRVGVNSKGFPDPGISPEQISLFQIFDKKENTMIVLGLRDWIHQEDFHFDYAVKYVRCVDEIKLIENFLSIFSKLDPLIVYAWNGSGFDFPYIFNRLKFLGFNTSRLSNYGNVTMTENEKKGRMYYRLNSPGHFFVDLEEVYKKFIKAPRPNYKLDTIAEIELKLKKVEHTEYAAFDDFYTGKYIIPENPTKKQAESRIYKAALEGNFELVKELAHSEFVYYGVVDTYIIREIDRKLNFTAILTMISGKMGVQVSDSLGTVKPWAQYIMNKAYLTKRITPPKTEYPDTNIIGGYVRDPRKGKHRWVLSADVNSMYPLLGMVGFNMSPETYIAINKLPPDLRDIVLVYFNNQEESERFEMGEDAWERTTSLLLKYNMSLGINGAVFDKSKLGMIPELVQEIYNSRKIAKGTMFEYEKQQIQIKHILKMRKG